MAPHCCFFGTVFRPYLLFRFSCRKLLSDNTSSLLSMPPLSTITLFDIYLSSLFSPPLPVLLFFVLCIHSYYFCFFFADLFNPFPYSQCVFFPPSLHLNYTNPVYICQLQDYPIFMNIIEHIPVVRK